MQSQDGTDHGAEIHHKHHIVGLGRQGRGKLRGGEIGQEIENVLQLIHDPIVDGDPAFKHMQQVLVDGTKFAHETTEGRDDLMDLFLDSGEIRREGERRNTKPRGSSPNTVKKD